MPSLSQRVGHRAVVAMAVALAAAGSSLIGQGVPAARDDAARCQQKLDRIARLGVDPAPAGGALRLTVLSERELNAYSRVALQPQLPAGVVDPAVVLAGGGRFTVRVVFDLDVVRRAQERDLSDPLRYLGGRVALSLTATLRTAAGRGVLEFVSATAGGVPLPKVVVQELVVYATRSPDTPEGFRFDAPFALPANIREILVGSGQATVIQ